MSFSSLVLLSLLSIGAAWMPAARGPAGRPPATVAATFFSSPEGARFSLPSMAVISLPSSPKEVAAQMSLSVQSAISAGLRRLELTLPDGLCFGLTGSSAPGKQLLGAGQVQSAARERGDREAAYLVLDMFQGLGNEACACVFTRSDACEAAAREREPKVLPRLGTTAAQVMPRGLAGFGGAAGGAAGKKNQKKKKAPPSPPTTAPRLIVMVRPKVRELKELELLVEPLGDEIVVVLLNPPQPNRGSRRGFEPCYTLLSDPHNEWRGGLLFRAYPSDWALGAAAKVGAPRIHGRSDTRRVSEHYFGGSAGWHF